MLAIFILPLFCRLALGTPPPSGACHTAAARVASAAEKLPRHDTGGQVASPSRFAPGQHISSSGYRISSRASANGDLVVVPLTGYTHPLALQQRLRPAGDLQS